MDIFTTGIAVLLVVTAILFIVLFSFVYYWHLKKVTFFVVPMVFIFEFFVAGFFVISIATIILNYLPELARVVGL
jgi:hypothetical protein